MLELAWSRFMMKPEAVSQTMLDDHARCKLDLKRSSHTRLEAIILRLKPTFRWLDSDVPYDGPPSEESDDNDDFLLSHREITQAKQRRRKPHRRKTRTRLLKKATPDEGVTENKSLSEP